ncbi:type I methionyl aminopeptidase [Candidatus Uhrbacteria bacterium]|nr:type I methionyl aminopeptidase [Candidatus Uhrbacteria bacterium]
MTAKTREEIEIMREGGRILAAALQHIVPYAEPGTHVRDLDSRAEEYIRNAGGIPAFLGYGGSKETLPYPATLCISINDEVVHGIGTRDRVLQSGDIVGFDIGMAYPADNGLYTDMAITIGTGRISDAAMRLMRVTKESLARAISFVRHDVAVRTIGKVVQQYCESHGYGVVRDLTGHGIGKNLHEDPPIFNYDEPRAAATRLTEGMTICIEPMISVGTWKVKMDPDGWTIRTADGSLAAHFEHTILVQRNGAEILTEL